MRFSLAKQLGFWYHHPMIVAGLILWCLINIAGLVMMGWDKWQAVCSGRDDKKKPRRISERRLLLIALCGGWLGIFVGINLFGHKTVKSSFLWRFYGIGFGWLAIFLWIMVS